MFEPDWLKLLLSLKLEIPIVFTDKIIFQNLLTKGS